MSSITTLFRRNVVTGLRERGWFRLADEFERDDEDGRTGTKQKLIRSESPVAGYVADFLEGRVVKG